MTTHMAATACKDCTHSDPDLKYGGGPYALACAAPQVQDHVEEHPGGFKNSFISCQDARDVKSLCGSKAVWFVARAQA